VRLLLFALPFLLSLTVADAAAQARRGRPTPRKPARARATPPTAAPAPRPDPAAVITPSGLTYLITRRGEGRTPKAGEEVLVHYTGLLTDGTVFDSSRNRGEPFSFKLGEGRVIKGWDEGIARLRVGDRATLFIPPQLGYGARGAGGVIPPDASLIFVVELVGIRGDEPPGGASRPPGQ
jgi:peptidylprolyl isomerase